MKIQKPSSSGLKTGNNFKIAALLLAGALLFGSGWGVQRCAAGVGFPTAPTNGTTFSIGVFQLQVDPSFAFLFASYPGYCPTSGLLTSPVMYDVSTMIGESATYNRGTQSFSPPVAVGTPAGYPAGTTYSNVLGYSDYYSIPSAFSSAPAGVDQIFTEMQDLKLQAMNSTSGASNNVCPDTRVPDFSSTILSVVAGPNEIPNLPLNRRSLGILQQLTPGGPTASDFPGQSFFNMYVQVTLPPVPTTASINDFPGAGAVIYNDVSDPLLVVNNNVLSVPPAATYIHEESTAVPVRFLTSNPPYWAAGDVVGYLTLAGHGVFTNTSPLLTLPPPPCLAAATGGLLDQILGPQGSPNLPPPIPWLRSNNSITTPNPAYNSLVNTFVDPTSGMTNYNDDTVSFTTPSGIYTLRDFTLAYLGTSLSPPAPGNPTDLGTPVAINMQVSSTHIYGDSDFHQSSSSSTVTLLVTNTGTSGNTTIYAMELQNLGYLSINGSSVYVRLDPGSPSLGTHTITPDPRGYRVSSVFNLSLQLSDDNGTTWYNASKTLNIQAGMPNPIPNNIFVSQIGNKALFQWQNNFTLQTTTNLGKPFTDVPGPITSGKYTNGLAGTAFFRLRQ